MDTLSLGFQHEHPDLYDSIFEYFSIKNCLLRRGYKVVRIGDESKIISPRFDYGTFGRHRLMDYYNLFKSGIFRQLLKLISENHSISLEKINLGISPDKLSSYLNNLQSLYIIDLKDGEIQYLQKEKEYSFTFEWFISQVISREFSGISSWGIKISDYDFGDFDVIAKLEDEIAYIECKSGNSNNISKNDLINISNRERLFSPSFSIIVIDTNGLTDAFKKRCDEIAYYKKLVPRKFKGNYFYEIWVGCYIADNTNQNLINNIRLAINHYFAVEKNKDRMSRLQAEERYDNYEEIKSIIT